MDGMRFVIGSDRSVVWPRFFSSCVDWAGRIRLENGDSDTTITRSINNINNHVDGKLDVRWSWFGDTRYIVGGRAIWLTGLIESVELDFIPFINILEFTQPPFG